MDGDDMDESVQGSHENDSRHQQESPRGNSKDNDYKYRKYKDERDDWRHKEYHSRERYRNERYSRRDSVASSHSDRYDTDDDRGYRKRDRYERAHDKPRKVCYEYQG